MNKKIILSLACLFSFSVNAMERVGNKLVLDAAIVSAVKENSPQQVRQAIYDHLNSMQEHDIVEEYRKEFHRKKLQIKQKQLHGKYSKSQIKKLKRNAHIIYQANLAQVNASINNKLDAFMGDEIPGYVKLAQQKWFSRESRAELIYKGVTGCLFGGALSVISMVTDVEPLKYACIPVSGLGYYIACKNLGNAIDYTEMLEERTQNMQKVIAILELCQQRYLAKYKK